jgi:zinc ribbon protein
MKTCGYCGHQNQDEAAFCSGCGTDEFETDTPVETVKPDPQNDLVLLTTCRVLADADLIVSRLAGAGIEAFIPDELVMQNAGFNLNTYGYVRVQVRRRDYPGAKDLLSSPDPGA